VRTATSAILVAVLTALGEAAQSAAVAMVQPEQPGALALGPNGALYIADRGRSEILERLANGSFRVIAGTGRPGFSGDGGPAVDAKLHDPAGMTVTANGTLYFADQGNNRVRAVSPQGRISTVAGNGRLGWVESGARALAASVSSPTAVTLGPGKLLYIAASGNEILRLNESGTLSRIAGNQRYEGVYGVGKPAVNASPDGPNGLAFDHSGDLFIAGINTKTLLMIDRSGTMRTPIGMTGFYPRGSGGIVSTPTDGVMAMQTQSIVEITPKSIHTVYSFAGHRIAGITGFLPNGIAIGPSGTIYVDTDGNNGWATGTAIVSVSPNHALSVLWHG
jgi:hypothetical protein